MFNNILRDYKKSYKSFIPFEFMADEGIVFNKNLGFQATFKVRFLDLDYQTEDTYDHILNSFNSAYKGLQDGYSIHIDVTKTLSDKYPSKDLTDNPYPVQIIEKIREKDIKSGITYVIDYYITVTYIMSKPVLNNVDNYISVFKNIFPNKKKKSDESLSKIYKDFEREYSEFKNQIVLFKERMKIVTLKFDLLKGEDLLKYLYYTINFEKREKINVPKYGEVLLDEYLTNSTLKKGEVCKINDEYFKVLTINMFPNETNLRIFKNLETLPFEFRYTTRYIMLSQEESVKILDNYRMYYEAKVKTFYQWILESFTQSKINEDTVAKEKSRESLFALDELKTGELAYGYYTFTFIIKDKNLDELEKKVLEVKKIINIHGFNLYDDRYNTLDSLFGSIPGNIVSNIRKYPINTYLLSALTPISSIYTGDLYNKHFKDVALITTKADTDLFYFNIHNKDIGHTMIIGSTGSGKSTLLGMIASEFSKYSYKKILKNKNGEEKTITKNAQIFFFDSGGSSRVLTQCSGGKFYDLGKNELAFQPLKNIGIKNINDEDEIKRSATEKEWALNWILNILEKKMTVTATTEVLVSNALNSLANTKEESRTLSNFVTYVQSPSIREVLTNYIGDGLYARYFDNNQDNLTENNFISFELGDLLKNKNNVVIESLLDYLFHKIEVEKLDGTPTLIILDECWTFLKNDKMSNKMQEWLQTLRKLNTSVVFATQTLSDVIDSKIAFSIMDSCKSQIFLPNQSAISESFKHLYEQFNLNDKEIMTIARAIPKMDYYLKNEEGSRLFQLNLTNTELAYVGSNSKNDQDKINNLVYTLSQNKFINQRERLRLLNKEWLYYKFQNGEIPISELKIYKDILK